MTIDQLQEDIKQYIQNYTSQGITRQKDSNAIEADLLWDASRFWAHVIHKSLPIREKMTYSEFKDYKSQYETDNNIKINSDELFERFWLRNVLGYIQIPGGISSLCNTFEKLLDFKDELKFIDYLYPLLPEKDKKSDKNQIQNILADYNTVNSTSITIDDIWQQNRFEIKDDVIKLNNFEHYYSPFLFFWNDFEFLLELKKRYKEHDKGLKILKSDFDIIYNKFFQFYSAIPTLESLLAQKVLRYELDSYYINFHDSDVSYFDLCDKISGFYWDLLLSDSSFKSDKERVFCCLSKILYWEGNPNVLNYCSENAKKRFLDEAFSIIDTENDLEGVEDEIKKVRIDSYHIHGIYEITLEKKINNHKLNDSDLFELYESVSKLEHSANIIFLHDQRSRSWIFYLLWIIVKNDFESEAAKQNTSEEYPFIFHYKRITQLLTISKKRPSLLGKIVSDIIYTRREIIPYLLKNTDFISLSFQIINQFKFQEEQETLSNKLWAKCLQLALTTICSQHDKDLSSKLIFQIFRQINIHKYEINNNPRIVAPKTDYINRERLLLDLIEKSSNSNHFHYSKTSDNFLLPSIINELAEHFIALQEDNIYNNGVIKLPLIKLDGLSWLMRCSTYWRYKNQLSDSDFNIQSITQNFFDIYVNTIEINEIDKYDFINKEQEKTIPIWAEKSERIKVIDWLFPIWFIYKNRLLNKFLEPKFVFEYHNDYFNKKNHFTAEKLRSHIAILLQIHKKLILPIIPYGLRKETLNTIKRRIEEKILDLLEDNSQNKPIEGKVDIFDFNQEWRFQSSVNEALLPQIAHAINYFSDKETLIDIIIKSNDVIKILTFAESISSESIKQNLIDKIKKADISLFLQNSGWIPEIQTTLSKLAMYPELISQIEDAIDFWEKEVISKKTKVTEYKKVLYQTRLLLAYFKEDEKELNNTQAPSYDGAIVIDDISDKEMKDFFRALIRLKDSPEISYNIFNDLTKRYPKHVNIALNRMAAKISMAEKDNNIDYYSEALEEWEEYKNIAGNDISENNLGVTFIANKMLIYFKTQQFELLNWMYSNLDMLYQMDPKILKINIDTLTIQGKSVEASLLQEEAKIYHKLTFSEGIDDVNKIKRSIREDDIIEELKSYYDKIFNNKPEKLIKIFPEKINGKFIINEFITKEFALAASKMLDKIMSISDIKGENKYNDIIELAVDSRITPWGWTVGGQSRGGFSNPKDKSTPKEPGERDLPIMDTNKIPFCICEAFIYRDKSSAIDHVQKIFNYYHQHKNLIILVYNLIHNDFENNWNEYKKDIIPASIFPSGHEFKSIIEVSGLFDYDNSAIKIAQSNHANEIVMHHVFVNIDYRINTCVKKIK
jgi:hypothetical protein